MNVGQAIGFSERCDENAEIEVEMHFVEEDACPDLLRYRRLEG